MVEARAAPTAPEPCSRRRRTAAPTTSRRPTLAWPGGAPGPGWAPCAGTPRCYQIAIVARGDLEGDGPRARRASRQAGLSWVREPEPDRDRAAGNRLPDDRLHLDVLGQARAVGLRRAASWSFLGGSSPGRLVGGRRSAHRRRRARSCPPPPARRGPVAADPSLPPVSRLPSATTRASAVPRTGCVGPSRRGPAAGRADGSAQLMAATLASTGRSRRCHSDAPREGGSSPHRAGLASSGGARSEDAGIPGGRVAKADPGWACCAAGARAVLAWYAEHARDLPWRPAPRRRGR